MWCLMWCLLRRLVGAGRTLHIHQLKSSGEGKGSLHRFTFRRGRTLTWRWCAGAVVTSKATTPSSTPMDCCRMSPKEQSIEAVGVTQTRQPGRGTGSSQAAPTDGAPNAPLPGSGRRPSHRGREWPTRSQGAGVGRPSPNTFSSCRWRQPSIPLSGTRLQLHRSGGQRPSAGWETRVAVDCARQLHPTTPTAINNCRAGLSRLMCSPRAASASASRLKGVVHVECPRAEADENW